MTSVPWEITHSVETNASPAFAWHYWTNVANWDDPPAEFELDGPFATGSRGCQGRSRYTGSSERLLRPIGLADGRTRLTQRIVLKGQKADIYLSQVKAAFTANLPDGMNKLATAMANADASHKKPKT